MREGVGALAETFDLAEPLTRVAEGAAWRTEDVDRKARRAARLVDADMADASESVVDGILEQVLDGAPVGPTTSATLRAWTANEGSRVPAILRTLDATPLDDEQRALTLLGGGA